MNERQLPHAVDSSFDVDPHVEHIDIFAISVANRVQRLLARVTMEGDNFAVHSPGGIEKRILSRVESSVIVPRSLEDLGRVFDAPQMMASHPHALDVCPFGECGKIGLIEREPQLTLL